MLIVAIDSVLTMCAETGAATRVASVKSSGGPTALARVTDAAMDYAPAALVFVAITALIFAVIPRLAIPLGWDCLASESFSASSATYCYYPSRFRTSPFRHSPALPAEKLERGIRRPPCRHGCNWRNGSRHPHQTT